MRIACFIFDGITALDVVGPYEVLQRIPDAEVVFCAKAAGEVRTDNGHLALVADRSIDEVSEVDILVVPGGWGTQELVVDQTVLEWIRIVHATSTWTTSSLVTARRTDRMACSAWLSGLLIRPVALHCSQWA